MTDRLGFKCAATALGCLALIWSPMLLLAGLLEDQASGVRER